MSFEKIWDAIKDFVYTSGWRIVAFFAVLLFGIITVRGVGKILRRVFAKGKLGKSLGGFLVTVIKLFLYLALLFVLAGIIGIDMQPLTTILLSAGLAVSLALQDSLSNVANGMIIVSTKPFAVGDFIEVAGVAGTVRKIGMISTELITIDNRKITIPNTKIMGDVVINISARPTRRIDFVFHISRDTDTELVKKTLYQTLESHPNALFQPPPMVKLSAITDNSFDYIARVWVNSPDYWETYWELNEQFVAEFAKNNIKIPYKTFDINMGKTKEFGKTDEDTTSTSFGKNFGKEGDN